LRNHAFKLASLVSAIALATSGCVASHTWAPGPHQSAANFTETSGRCKLVSMGAANSGGEFAYAQGSPQFVGSYLGAVTVASAIGAHNRGQGTYNACMEANGFVEADNLSPANPRVAQVKEILNQTKACREAINNSPIYAALRPYHSVDGKYTPAQLANTAVPTPAESQLLVAYIDEGQRTCTDRYLPEMTRVSPTAGQIFTQMVADIRATQQLLVNRQLSWGEAAQRGQAAAEAAAEKVRTQGV
jgi:hypothetical protein